MGTDLHALVEEYVRYCIKHNDGNVVEADVFKDESKASIANKLARGTFPTPFFLAALVAIGAEIVRLEDI
jgi:hypothetical protein